MDTRKDKVASSILNILEAEINAKYMFEMQLRRRHRSK